MLMLRRNRTDRSLSGRFAVCHTSLVGEITEPELTPMRRPYFVAAERVTEIFRTAPRLDARKFRVDLDDIASQEITPRG